MFDRRERGMNIQDDLVRPLLGGDVSDAASLANPEAKADSRTVSEQVCTNENLCREILSCLKGADITRFSAVSTIFNRTVKRTRFEKEMAEIAKETAKIDDMIALVKGYIEDYESEKRSHVRGWTVVGGVLTPVIELFALFLLWKLAPNYYENVVEEPGISVSVASIFEAGMTAGSFGAARIAIQNKFGPLYLRDMRDEDQQKFDELFNLYSKDCGEVLEGMPATLDNILLLLDHMKKRKLDDSIVIEVRDVEKLDDGMALGL